MVGGWRQYRPLYLGMPCFSHVVVTIHPNPRVKFNWRRKLAVLRHPASEQGGLLARGSGATPPEPRFVNPRLFQCIT